LVIILVLVLGEVLVPEKSLSRVIDAWHVVSLSRCHHGLRVISVPGYIDVINQFLLESKVIAK
jgi:hypothetical protein